MTSSGDDLLFKLEDVFKSRLCFQSDDTDEATGRRFPLYGFDQPRVRGGEDVQQVRETNISCDG